MDTSALITLEDPSRNHHAAAVSYLRETVNRGWDIMIPSIVLAEYALLGDYKTLLDGKGFKVVGFNFREAIEASEFPIVIDQNDGSRVVIKDDAKILATANIHCPALVLTDDSRMVLGPAKSRVESLHWKGATTRKSLTIPKASKPTS